MTGLFIPECLTPLAFTPLYASLCEEHRLSYNRLHGRYFLEQTIFFEQIMGRPVLEALHGLAPSEAVRKKIAEFLSEENAHSSWFRSLLREVMPQTYDKRDFVLLAAPAWSRILMEWSARRVRSLPAMLWLQLIAEERAIYFGREFLAARHQLDDRFFTVQQRHMADEVGHVRSDESFIQWLWPATPSWLRHTNARFLQWALCEFFYLPKRSGWRVVDAWLHDHPELQERRPAVRRAWQELGMNPDFLATLYPKKHLTRTLALAADWPELAFFNRFFSD